MYPRSAVQNRNGWCVMWQVRIE